MTGYQVVLALHVLGASVWVGGHLVLVLAYLPRALRSGDAAELRAFESRYERVGIPALALQVLTGLDLARRHVPPAEWFSFAEGPARHVGVKLVLLLLTLALALHARLRLVPRLESGALRPLAAHVVLVTLLAVAMAVVGAGIRTGGVV